MIWEVEMLIRLLLAVLFGGLIGFERESLNKAAGLRTHALVSVGSCLIMLVSISLTPRSNLPGISVDSARIAAQVVSGVGFLGAGTIMRSGVNVKGLTTAATLWVVAGIGLAVGSGLYIAAFFTTILVYVLLVYFYRIEKMVSSKKRHYCLIITVADKLGQMGLVTGALRDLDVQIENIDFKDQRVDNLVQIEIGTRLPYQLSVQKLKDLLMNIEGIHQINWR